MKVLVIGAISLVASVAILASSAFGNSPKHDYDAWTSEGVHLFMCDNGTPDDFEDDWVYDWETNRDFTIQIRR